MRAREAACRAVDGADATDGHHREELLAQAGVSSKMGMIDGWVGGDLTMQRDIAVRELAADDVGVGRKGGMGRREELQIVRHGGIVVAGDLVSQL